MILKRCFRVGFLLAVVAGLTTVQQILPRPAKTLWWNVVYDAGHVPLFGLFALAILGLTMSLVRRTPGRHLRHYAFAFGVTAVAGCVIELIQWGAPSRTATLVDVARNLAGSAAFLVMAATLDPKAQVASGSRKTALRLTAAALVVLALVPVWLTGAAILRRNAVFPRLSEFESRLGRYLVGTLNVELEESPLPGPWADGGSSAARVTFLPEHPAILALRAPYPDWSGYDRLVLAIFSDLDRPVELSLKIQDQIRLPALGDVFKETLTIQPGVNRFLIPLSRIRRLPSGREMKMTRIHRIALKAEKPDTRFSVWMSDLRLE